MIGLSIVFILVLPSVCSGITVFGSDIVEVNSARALAMGAVSIVINDGNTAYLINPAAMVLVPNSTINIGISMDHISEESFGGKEQNLDNSQTYFNALRSQGVILKSEKLLTFALSRGLLGDYTTKSEEKRQNQTNTNDTKGGLYSISFSAARKVVPKLAIGASLNLLRGSKDGESFETITQQVGGGFFQKPETQKTSTGETVEESESGTNFNFGGLYIANERLRIGAAYKTSCDIERKVKTKVIRNGQAGNPESTKEKWTYPASMGAGIAYKYASILFVGEVHRTNWSDYKYSELGQQPTKPKYEDLNTFHLGAEYEISMPNISAEPILLRGGFYTSPFYFVEDASTNESSGYFVTAGAGLNLSGVKIDIAGQFGKKTFSVPEQAEYEASIQGFLGNISYEFDLSNVTSKLGI
jgi:long-subunit fatty acid transport protein